MKIKNINKIILLLILSFALLLRLWRLDLVPVSLFGDEVDIGYHAYSLLKTGRDYSGNFFPIQLNSLADQKSPLYAYSIIPTVAIFGISPLGVRLPAMLFGLLNIWLLYLLINLLTKNKAVALLSAFVLATSPWHIHYSRWGFEGTEMLALYLGGLYCFMKGLEHKKWLIFSAVLLGLTPWAYHAAKIFLPVTLLLLLLIWRKSLMAISKKYLSFAAIIFILVIAPVIFSMLTGSGVNRFSGTSVFNDPTIIPEIGFQRLRDSEVIGDGQVEIFMSRLFHYPALSWADKISNNYLRAFSTDFLFIKGDPNLRQSIPNTGEFYKFEIAFLILGILFSLRDMNGSKWKIFIGVWLILAPLPAIITSDGGSHASRLLFLLPVLSVIIALGIYYGWQILPSFLRKSYFGGLTLIFILSLTFYGHSYWVHYPWDSERWWHAGYESAINSVITESPKYDKVIISNADEPSLIFFLSWSEYSPEKFQENYPLVKEEIPGFGQVLKLEKYYFPSQGFGVGLYELGKVIPPNTLYLATAKEINLDLINEPGRVPGDIRLIKSIAYPSGKPAFYLFDKP